MKFFTALVFVFLFAAAVFAQKQAEVTVMSTHIRAQPDQKSEKVITVERGAIVVFEKNREKSGWFFVTVLSENVKGWIRGDVIRRLEKAAPERKQKTAPPSKVATSSPPKKTIVSAVPNETVRIAEPSPRVEPAIAAADAAPPVEDDEVLKIDTEEVSLNVRVVDEKNRTVNSLNQAQFSVYEDDVLQPIVSMTTMEIPMISALVIDNSRSLRTQLGKVVEAGKIIVGANRPKDESTIVRFISSDKIEVIQDFTTSRNSLNYALENLYVEGGRTAIIDAVYLAAKKVENYQKSENEDDNRLRVLIVVSDGDDRSSTYDEQSLFKLLRESNVQIYAVGFTNDLSRTASGDAPSRQEKAVSLLTRLAQETGGKVYFPASMDDLPQIASEISGELRTQYLISYAPTNETRDGTFRKIRVEVSDGANNTKRKAITRTGRNSPPSQ